MCEVESGFAGAFFLDVLVYFTLHVGCWGSDRLVCSNTVEVSGGLRDGTACWGGVVGWGNEVVQRVGLSGFCEFRLWVVLTLEGWRREDGRESCSSAAVHGFAVQMAYEGSASWGPICTSVAYGELPKLSENLEPAGCREGVGWDSSIANARYASVLR